MMTPICIAVASCQLLVASESQPSRGNWQLTTVNFFLIFPGRQGCFNLDRLTAADDFYLYRLARLGFAQGIGVLDHVCDLRAVEADDEVALLEADFVGGGARHDPANPHPFGGVLALAVVGNGT